MSGIIDAQVHVWGPATPDRPWPAGRGKPQRPVPLSAEDLLVEMEQAGVDQVVLVPPSWQGDQNDFALEAARKYPDRFAVMGRFDVLSEHRPEVLRTWREPGMLGVRLTLHDSEGARALAEEKIDWFWAAAADNAVPVMVYAPGALAAVAEVAARFPRLSLTVCHAGLPIDVREPRLWSELEHLWPLAEYDNVAVKASALPTYVEESWPFREVQKVVRRMVDTFGMERVFWGSDLSRLTCPYGELVRFFRDLDFPTDGEKEWVLGRGIAEWLRWSPASD